MDFLRQHGFLRTGVILAAAVTAAAAAAPGQTTAPASGPAPEAPAAKTRAASELVGGRENRPVSKADPASTWRGLAQTLGALVVVGGIMVALWLGLRRVRRRVGTAGGQDAPAVLARTSLSSRHHIYVVRWAGRLLLVGTGPQGISLLSDTAAPPAATNQTDNQEAQAST
ncbi:MAG: flagellar biosynthetic protein FliO [Planctomycetota bacterium]|nr:flagellar biosynthetic protein FliO [Planctomycetota bacterium]